MSAAAILAEPVEAGVVMTIGRAGLGGHTRSAVAIARALQERGTRVEVVAWDGGGREVLEASGLPTRFAGTGDEADCAGSRAFVSAVLEAARPLGRCVVHAFDGGSLVPAARAAAALDAPLLLTICGGPTPVWPVPQMWPVVVFSEELRRGIEFRWGVRGALVSAARVDLPRRRCGPAAPLLEGARPSVPAVLMIGRLANLKLRSFLLAIEAVELVSSETEMTLTVVGRRESRLAGWLIERRARSANRRRGTTVVTVSQRDAGSAARLLPAADLVIGVGRTVYEAMALGIPSLVVGEHGFAGVAEGAAVERMLEFNFSGRDARALAGGAKDARALAEAMRSLLANAGRAKAVGEQGRLWVAGRLDARSGAAFYQTLYARCLSSGARPPEPAALARLERHHRSRQLLRRGSPRMLRDFFAVLRQMRRGWKGEAA